MQSTPIKAAALLARISQDRTGERLGVELRQIPDLERLAADLGWPVAGHYIDNDISATRKNGKVAYRPELQRLITDIEAHRIDAVLAWDLDRAFRDPLEQEMFFLTCERSGMHHFRTLSDDINISTGEGTMVARIKAAVAAEEARKIQKRVQRKMLELADRGLPKGGPRPYGYESDYVTIKPSEAAGIREAAKRVLEGESCAAIVQDWNSTGRYVTATGGAWRGNSLKHVLKRPRTAGLREHQGEVVGEAVWPPVLDRTTWERVCLRLAPRTTPGPRKVYLLSGIARCAACGGVLSGSRSRGGVSHTGRLYYPHAPSYHCPVGHMGIQAERTDALVVATLKQHLETSVLQGHASPNRGNEVHDLIEDIAVIETRLGELANDYYRPRPLITRDQFTGASERLQGELSAAKSAVSRIVTADARHEDPACLLEQFDRLSLERKRLVISSFLDVTVSTAVKGPVWDPDRVVVRARL